MTTPHSVVDALWSRVRAATGDILDAIRDIYDEVKNLAAEVRGIRDTGAVPNDAVGLPQLAPSVRSTVEGLPTALAGKADVVDGKVPTSQIPAVALTKPSSVTSRAQMLALDVQEGDVAIITTGDDKGSYMLGDGPANVFESWHLLAVSEDAPVQTVNGQVGTVVLGAGDVGAAPAGHSHTPQQVGAAPADHDHDADDLTDATTVGKALIRAEGAAAARGAIDAAAEGHTHTREQVTGLDDALAGKAPSHVEVTGDWPTTGTPGVLYWKAEV